MEQRTALDVLWNEFCQNHGVDPHSVQSNLPTEQRKLLQAVQELPSNQKYLMFLLFGGYLWNQMEGFDEQMSFFSLCKGFLQGNQQLNFIETTIAQLQLDIHPHNCSDETINIFIDFLRDRQQGQLLAYYYMILADVYHGENMN